MKYIIEVRDLTNESKELKNITDIVESNIKIHNQTIEILTKSHYRAICSYFSHLFHELEKMNFTIFDANINCNTISIIKIENRHYRGYALWLNDGQGSHNYYILMDDEMKTLGTNFIGERETLEENTELFERLLCYWELLKEEIEKEIQKRVDESLRTQTIKNNESNNRLSLYQNFEL